MKDAITIVKSKPVSQVALLNFAFGVTNCVDDFLWYFEWSSGVVAFVGIRPSIAEELAVFSRSIVHCYGKIQIRPAGSVAKRDFDLTAVLVLLLEDLVLESRVLGLTD